MVALLLDDLASEQHALHVKDGQAIIVHFLFRMKRRHIQAATDSLSDAKEGAARHPEILRHFGSLTLITHNLKDVERTRVRCMNPYRS